LSGCTQDKTKLVRQTIIFSSGRKPRVRYVNSTGMAMEDGVYNWSGKKGVGKGRLNQKIGINNITLVNWI